MNIYTFSMLYQWIHNSYQILMNIDTLSTEGLDDDDICIDAELKLYRSQAQAIGSGSRSSWLSRSTSMGMSVSPTPSSSSPTPEVCKLWMKLKTLDLLQSFWDCLYFCMKQINIYCNIVKVLYMPLGMRQYGFNKQIGSMR